MSIGNQLLGAGDAAGAEYEGELIDGHLFDAVAYSYDTGKYYDVQVEFDGDEATIHFARGGRRAITIDDEEIEDPHSISGYDYERSTFWDLDVGGLD